MRIFRIVSIFFAVLMFSCGKEEPKNTETTEDVPLASAGGSQVSNEPLEDIVSTTTASETSVETDTDMSTDTEEEIPEIPEIPKAWNTVPTGFGVETTQRYSIAGNKAGQVYVAWNDGNKIQAKRYDNGWQTIEDNILSVNNNYEIPAIDLNESGNAIGAIMSAGIKAFSYDGSDWLDSGLVPEVLDPETLAGVTIDENNNYIVGWNHSGNNLSPKVNRYSNGSNSWSGISILGSGDHGEHPMFNQNFMIWKEYDSEGHTSIKATRFNESWDSAVRLDLSGFNIGQQKIAGAGNYALAVWAENNKIFASNYNSGFTPAIELESPKEHNFNPSVAVNENGQGIIVFHGMNLAYPNVQKLYAVVFDGSSFGELKEFEGEYRFESGFSAVSINNNGFGNISFQSLDSDSKSRLYSVNFKNGAWEEIGVIADIGSICSGCNGTKTHIDDNGRITVVYYDSFGQGIKYDGELFALRYE